MEPRLEHEHQQQQRDGHRVEHGARALGTDGGFIGRGLAAGVAGRRALSVGDRGVGGRGDVVAGNGLIRRSGFRFAVCRSGACRR